MTRGRVQNLVTDIVDFTSDTRTQQITENTYHVSDQLPNQRRHPYEDLQLDRTPAAGPYQTLSSIPMDWYHAHA